MNYSAMDSWAQYIFKLSCALRAGFIIKSMALIGAVVCSACSMHDPALEPLANIPIEVRNGLPTVDVRVAGVPLKLFLDLGGGVAMSLTPFELSRVNVQFESTTRQSMNSRGQVFESRLFVAKNVFLGDFFLGNLAGGEFIFGDAVPPDRNGYIGLPILGRYLLVMDYPRKRIRFYNSGDTDALASECGTDIFKVNLVDGVAVSKASTEHGDLLFVWDTGATVNIIRPSVLLHDNVQADQRDDGPPIVRIEKLKLGNRDVGSQEFRLFQFAAPAVDAYLGAGLFATRKVCLDITRGIGAIQ